MSSLDRPRVAVRRAAVADLPAVRALVHESWRRTYGPLIGEAAAVKLSAAKHAPYTLSAQLRTGHPFLVAETPNGTLAGTLYAYPQDGLYIDRLHAHPDGKGRGVGTALVEACATLANGERLWLDVLEGNDAALRFYRARGFSLVGSTDPSGGLAGVPATVLERHPVPHGHATPADVLATYERQAAAFASDRSRGLTERPALERFAASLPGPRVLDVGCGTGEPIARWLTDRGCIVTGIDGAESMVARFAKTVGRAIHGDMRSIDLGETFDGVVAWDSLFHLTPAAQRATLRRLARHTVQGGALLFTSGPEAGEAWGRVGLEAVYHASLSPDGYRATLGHAGFKVVAQWHDDPALDHHTVWLARRL